jgi:hypothetical protein
MQICLDSLDFNLILFKGEDRSVSVGVVVADDALSLLNYLPEILLALVFLGGVTFFWFLLFRRRDRKDERSASFKARDIGYQPGA